VPLAATTYWFSSKEELIREAFEESARRDAARFARQRAAIAAWAPDQVADRLAETVLELLTEERESTVVDYSLWVEAARRPELRAVADRWSATCRDFYAVALERACAAEPERDAHVVSAAVDGLLMEQIVRDVPDRDRVFAVVGRLIRALTA
jgi:TetR/AcrR family transcriptional regulator, regulator of biofilm formation and stress response